MQPAEGRRGAAGRSRRRVAAVFKDSKFKEVAVDFLIWEHSTKAVLRDFELRQVRPTTKKACDDHRLNEPVSWFNGQRLGTYYAATVISLGVLQIVVPSTITVARYYLREGAETMLPSRRGCGGRSSAAAPGGASRRRC